MKTNSNQNQDKQIVFNEQQDDFKPLEHRNQKKIKKTKNQKILRQNQNVQLMEDNQKKELTTKEAQKLYWLSIIKYTKQNQFCKLSWKNWKADNFFSTMASYFKNRRDKKQIKSLDQRLKKRYFLQGGKDILQAVPIALNEYQLSPKQQIELNQFLKNKDQSIIPKILEIDEFLKNKDQQTIPRIQNTDLQFLNKEHLQFIERNQRDLKILQRLHGEIYRQGDQNNFFFN